MKTCSWMEAAGNSHDKAEETTCSGIRVCPKLKHRTSRRDRYSLLEFSKQKEKPNLQQSPKILQSRWQRAGRDQDQVVDMRKSDRLTHRQVDMKQNQTKANTDQNNEYNKLIKNTSRQTITRYIMKQADATNQDRARTIRQV